MFVFLFSLFTTVILVAAAPASRSTDWFIVEWEAPEFTAMSGNFVVPDMLDNDIIAWPGLQGENGVLQAELDSQSGQLTLGTSFYGLPKLLVGSRFQVYPGDSVHFSFTRIADSDLWMCTLAGPYDTEHIFSLPANKLSRAIFAVDLSSAPHDFTISYSDIIITAASTSAVDWCGTIASTGYAAGGYVVKDVTAEGTTCRIGQLILPGTT